MTACTLIAHSYDLEIVLFLDHLRLRKKITFVDDPGWETQIAAP